MTEESLPLTGVRIVELSLAIAAPSAGQVLGDYGADIVKIEPPSGDTQRYMVSGLGKSNPDPYKNSPHFYSVNRGKRSLVLDLKTQAGMIAMNALLHQADVFLSNYRYDALKRLGLDGSSLLARHPHLIICPMSGWGLEGPDASKPVYDVAGFWARSGAASSHTDTSGYPALLAPGFGDMATGLAAVGGICAALFAKHKTGKGRILTTSLLRTGLHCNTWAMSTYFASDRVVRWGERDRTGNPLATVYKAKDGKAFWIIGFEAARHWPTTVRVVDKPSWLETPRYKTPSDRRKNERELYNELQDIFSTKTRAEWANIFDSEGLWWAPVLDSAEAAADAQAVAAGSFIDCPISRTAQAAGRKKVVMVASPVDFLGAPKTAPARPTPELGEHTQEIIEELGLDSNTRVAILSQLRAKAKL